MILDHMLTRAELAFFVRPRADGADGVCL